MSTEQDEQGRQEGDETPGPLVVLEAMTRFQCNEQGCCCRGWRVDFSGPDMMKLQQLLDDAEFRDVCEGMEVLVDSQRRVHRVNLRQDPPDERCRFLDPQRHCNLQTRFGVEALPSLCQAFPTVPVAMPDGSYELPFDAICPEVRAQLDEDDGPLARIRLSPAEHPELAARLDLNHTIGALRIGSREVALDAVKKLRERLMAYLDDCREPMLHTLAGLCDAFGQLGRGLPVEHIEIPDRPPLEAFDAFFEESVSAHGSGILARTLHRFRRFIFEVELPEVIDPQALDYEPSWRQTCPPDLPELQPLLRRYMTARLFAIYTLDRDSNRVSFGYGRISHIMATTFRYAAGFAKCGIPFGRESLKAALGAADSFYRSWPVPDEAMLWFGLEPRTPTERRLNAD